MSDIKKINRKLWISSFSWLILLIASLALGFYLGMQYRTTVLDGFSDNAVCNVEKAEVEEEFVSIEEETVILKDKVTGEIIRTYTDYLDYWDNISEFLYEKSGMLLINDALYYRDYIENDDGLWEDVLIKKYDFDSHSHKTIVSLNDLNNEFFAEHTGYELIEPGLANGGKRFFWSLVDNRKLEVYATDAMDGSIPAYWIEPYLIDLFTYEIKKVDIPSHISDEYHHHYHFLNYNGKDYLYWVPLMSEDFTFFITEYDLDNNEALSDFIEIHLDKDDNYTPVYDNSLLEYGFDEEFFLEYFSNIGPSDAEMLEAVEKYMEGLSEYLDIEIVE